MNINNLSINTIKPNDLIEIIYILHKEKYLIIEPSDEVKDFINFFKINNKEEKYQLEIINDVRNLCQKYNNVKIEKGNIKKITDEINKITENSTISDKIYISFLGLANNKKNIILNEIIGRNLLPINLNELTQKCFFIKYSEIESRVIKKSKLIKEDITNFCFYEEQDIKELYDTNYDSHENKTEDDFFYYIETRINLFDEMGLDKSTKENIILIYLPDFEMNLFNNNSLIKNFLSISNAFVFLINNLKDDLPNIIEPIYHIKNESNMLFIETSLFILNKDEIQSKNQNIRRIKSFNNNITKGIILNDKDIKLGYFDFEHYFDFLNYFFEIINEIENEYEKYNYYQNLYYKEPSFFRRNTSVLTDHYKRLQQFEEQLNNEINNLVEKKIINRDIANEINEKLGEISESEDFSEFKHYINRLFFQENEITSISYNKYELSFFKKFLISSKNCLKKQFNEKFKKNMESIIKLLFTLPDSVTINIKGKIRNILETNKNNISLLGKKFKEIAINCFKNKKSYLENIIKTQKKEVVIIETEKEILNNLNGFNSQIKEFSNYITLNCESIKETINQFCKKKIDNFFLSETKFEEKILDEIRPKVIDIYDDIYGRKGIFDIFSKTSNSEYCETFINTIIDTFSKIMDSTILAINNNLIRYFTSLLNSNNEVNDILLEENEIIVKKLYSLHDLIKNPNYKEKYINLKKIGEGGYGTIYKANIKNTNELRALKIINKELLKANITKNFILFDEAEEEYKKCINCFMNEIENMKICSQYNTNNNSVKFYEYYDTEKEFIIVMELCDENLFSLLQERKKGLNKEEIYNIMNQLNNTFKIMVKKKIIHRDLKLENILIKYENKEKTKYTVKLIDYGISKKLDSLTRKQNTIIGTYSYMAPEILNEENYGNECDLWSLGVIIYRLIFIKFPYNADSLSGIRNIINNKGQSILKKASDDDLNNLIRKLLVKDPKDRMKWEEFFEFFNNN